MEPASCQRQQRRGCDQRQTAVQVAHGDEYAARQSDRSNMQRHCKSRVAVQNPRGSNGLQPDNVRRHDGKAKQGAAGNSMRPVGG